MNLEPGGVRSILGVAVKQTRCVHNCERSGFYSVIIPRRLPVAKASDQNGFDSEGRKLGEQNGLDTRVVPAVNAAS